MLFPCIWCPWATPPFPSPAASGLLHNNASPLVTMLVASQQLLLLEMKAVSSLAVPVPGMGTVSRFIHRQLLQQRGAWGRCFRVFAKHCGDLKCIQKATGTLSRAQTTAPPLESWRVTGSSCVVIRFNLLVVVTCAACSESSTLKWRRAGLALIGKRNKLLTSWRRQRNIPHRLFFLVLLKEPTFWSWTYWGVCHWEVHGQLASPTAENNAVR